MLNRAWPCRTFGIVISHQKHLHAARSRSRCAHGCSEAVSEPHQKWGDYENSQAPGFKNDPGLWTKAGQRPAGPQG